MCATTRGRGRPRLLERDAALEVAAKLFWQYGYEGTSIADLTKAMGVTPPSLYAAFGSKEELYRQAVDFQVDRQSKARSEALRKEPSAYRAVSFYLHDFAYRCSDPDTPRGCMISTAVLQHAKENEPAARIVAARRETAIQEIKTRFDRAVAEGELPPETDTDALARFFAAVVQGMSAQACDGAGEAVLQRLADIALAAWPGHRPVAETPPCS
ncbi:TetR family transcriptional regulator [Achromobacter sp. UMC46]|nr:TetR family transcriptional regulator [Achromobacter sp. UMC46]